MKYVGQLLPDAVIALQKQKTKFVIEYTIPPEKGFFKVDSNILYVIREKYLENGVLQLLAAAKMRKEV
ncbi:hypothetical protein [Pectinatus sottacetonis]|uniref:hypothetical protein n=1 Tax=Pectinatus sottacetonis TaxID=1002795 RepID=UPI0018C4546E|nr:hypothetical protein [Pectinatus sottacetonis]